jgi:hypothetical protein
MHGRPENRRIPAHHGTTGREIQRHLIFIGKLFEVSFKKNQT